MSELIRNLEEATDKAIKTGEKVITMQCPCCGKIFYVVESEATYQYDNPAFFALILVRFFITISPPIFFRIFYVLTQTIHQF